MERITTQALSSQDNRRGLLIWSLFLLTVFTVSCASDANDPNSITDGASVMIEPEQRADGADREQAENKKEASEVESFSIVGSPSPQPQLVAGDMIAGIAGGVVGGVAQQAPAATMRSFGYISSETGGPPGRSDTDEAWRYNADFNTEEYGRIVENPFLAVRDNPLSTFGVDVDRASYANLRRFLRAGQLPPRDAIRIEEMINYFSYDYPDPRGDAPFSITTEVAEAPWNSKNRLLLVGLQGRRIDTSDLPASNLVFLLDVSGSMDMPDKLPLLKSAMELLIENLDSDDTVSIVVYAGSAGMVLPPTPGSRKGAIWSAIDQLQAGGSTAGGAGIKLAYRLAEENFVRGGNNRVILATDGDFNVGASSDGELLQLIEQKRESGVFLTVLGFGTGNIKDSKMELLADKGNGNYAYIDSVKEAKKVLVSEMGGTLFTIAKDVKLQLEFNPATVLAYRLIGYENRLLRSEDFNDDRKDAGDMGAGHSVTALYEIVPPGGDVGLIAIDPLKYQSREVSAAATAGEMLTVKVRYKEPHGETSRLLTKVVTDPGNSFALASGDFRFAASVAQLGLLLRDSRFRGEASFEEVLRISRDASGTDAEGYRADFIELAAAARRISDKVQIQAMR